MSLNGVRNNTCDVRDSLKGVMVLPQASEGETLRFMRNAVGLSQGAVAQRAGIANGYVSEFEGDLMLPKPEQLSAIHGAIILAMADVLEKFAMALRAIQVRRVA